ncbi:MAG TPA: class I SAM-dependent methyltransferase [Pyrinomonadaceae bacterium]|nr:class I SAM-dependent methyltransferase [Pyrinomonadaceae bacterium]
MEEVFLWRGSTKQRALRSLAGKFGRFSYFNQQLNYPDWRNSVVLDFGGNEGNLLLDHNCTIRPENYYCLDVLKEALDEGRQRFPSAHWIHYNRYNCSFNPEGVNALPVPDLGIEFDMILAYSVFTHTTREDMHGLVKQLKARLAPGGILAFTFIDPHYHSLADYAGNNLRWRLEKNRERLAAFGIYNLLEQSRGAAWCTLINGAELHLNSNGTWANEARRCLSYNVYYSVGFMRREFPNASIHPPVNGKMQHCCLIRREL